MSNVVIRIENLSKQYRLGSISSGTISHDLNRWWHKLRGHEDPYLKIGEVNDRTQKGDSEYVWALRNVNVDIKHGEVLGIIGRNGAGKSTLLKILSRITAPSGGTIKVKGRIASLLEVGTGFHPELSGKENIYLNGAILGMSRQEIKRKFDEIVEFAGIERYIDTPVKRYSSGMYVRLAFAVAAHLEPEILVVDEVLAVGDAEFQRKCLGKMKDVSEKEGRTVLFVSHNLGSIQSLCTQALWMHNGNSEFIGDTNEVIKAYNNMLLDQSGRYLFKEITDKKFWFKSITVVNDEGAAKNVFFHDEDIYIEYSIENNIPFENADFSVFCMIVDSMNSRVFSAESDVLKSGSICLKIEHSQLVRGNYTIHTFIHKPRTEQVDSVENVCGFEIIDNGSPFHIHGRYDYGKVFGKVSWQYK